jgi:hypothetical protein
MTLCIGQTQKGAPCKRVVKNGGYCCNHVSQKHEFYENVYGWPRMSSVLIELNHRISWMPERKQLTEYLLSHCRRSRGILADITGRTIRPVYDKPFIFLLFCEALLRYREELLNGCVYMRELRSVIVILGPEIQAPKRYLDYVVAKTDPETYRKSKQLIATIILRHTVLCAECISHIVSFI